MTAKKKKKKDTPEDLEILSTSLPGEEDPPPESGPVHEEEATSATEASGAAPFSPPPEPPAKSEEVPGAGSADVRLAEPVEARPAKSIEVLAEEAPPAPPESAPVAAHGPAEDEPPAPDQLSPQVSDQSSPPAPDQASNALPASSSVTQDPSLPSLQELVDRAGRGPLLAVAADRREAVRLALTAALGRTLDAAPEALDARGLPAGAAAQAAAQLGRGDAPLGTLLLFTPEQRDQPVWCPLHSFEEALRDALFRRLSATLEHLLERQVLVGEITARPTPPTAAEQLLALEEVAITLDTPGRHLSSVSRFEQQLARLIAEPDLLLDEERVDGLVAHAQEGSAALGDLGGAGLTAPLELSLEVGSFWTAAFGGVYRLAARPPFLVLPGRRDAGGDSTDVVRLADPGLIDRLHAAGFLSFDTGLIEQRTRELEDQALLNSGTDPASLDDSERRRTVAGRARQMPRTWHELAIVRRAAASGPSGARVIHTLSAETKVKLSRPQKDVPVVSRLLAELDAIDYPRLFQHAPERFARDYEAAPPAVRRHMARAVLAPAEEPAPPAPAPEEPEETGDDEEITFL